MPVEMRRLRCRSNKIGIAIAQRGLSAEVLPGRDGLLKALLTTRPQSLMDTWRVEG
jgi:hypothetical protein